MIAVSCRASWWRRQSALQSGGMVADGGSSGIGVTDLIEMDQTASSKASDDESQAKGICMLHVTFGEEYSKLSEAITIPNKRRYAEKHGYTLLVSQAPSLDLLLAKYFAFCGFTPKHGADSLTTVKFCAIHKALVVNKCKAVLWTDSDALIFSSDITIESWLDSNPNADVFWSLGNSDNALCKESGHAAAGCPSLGSFVACLNAGAFLVRNTEWSINFAVKVLRRSRITHKDPVCNTANTNQMNKDQCTLPKHTLTPGPGYGDQCAVTCETIAQEDDDIMEHFECFGYGAKPDFQKVVYAGTAGFPQRCAQIHCEDAFVVNCMAHIICPNPFATLWRCTTELAKLAK